MKKRLVAALPVAAAAAALLAPAVSSASSTATHPAKTKVPAVHTHHECPFAGTAGAAV